MADLLTPPPGRHLPGVTDSTGPTAPQVPTGKPAVAPASRGEQLSFDDLDTRLDEVTFVVVDLETTGGSPTRDAITEFGAVKIRGGQVLGEFATLVNPGRAISPAITALTGITNSMVASAPAVAEVFPSFAEFSRGAVIVAHNARFDLGFLRAAARHLQMSWSPQDVVDTVALARRVVTKAEVPNHKLATLAGLFSTTVSPDHRALTDARATVDVFHGLLERLGGLGVRYLDDLRTATDPVPQQRRRKVTLADGLPTTPGVYQFLGPNDEVLYVGTATNLNARVRHYFTAGEQRRRIGEMVDLASRVHVVECQTPLEAHIRELRLIAAHTPAYNRRSKRPHRLPWLRLTDEPLPRLSIVRSVPTWDQAVAIGPFSSRHQAELALEAAQATGIRTCTQRLPSLPRPDASACILGQIGRCTAPCVDAGAAANYHQVTGGARYAFTGDPDGVVATLQRRMSDLAAAEKFEEAAIIRERLSAFLYGMRRSQRLRPLAEAAQVIAARWTGSRSQQAPRQKQQPHGWEIVIARHGALAGTIVSPAGVDPLPAVAALRDTAAQIAPPQQRCGAASPEETELLLAWLEQPGTRLIEFSSPEWSSPRRGAQYWIDRLGLQR